MNIPPQAMSDRAMNKPLLRKVKAAILAEPKKFKMDAWFEPDKESPCGTSACIAGHAIAIANKAKTINEAQEIASEGEYSCGKQARDLLKIGFESSEALFYEDQWPKQFRISHRYSSREELAKAAADRIDHFMATGE